MFRFPGLSGGGQGIRPGDFVAAAAGQLPDTLGRIVHGLLAPHSSSPMVDTVMTAAQAQGELMRQPSCHGTPDGIAYAAALASQEAYSAHHRSSFLDKEGKEWKLCKGEEHHCAYRTPTDLVIAFRGTADWKDLATDATILVDSDRFLPHTPRYEESIEFVRLVKGSYQEGRKLILTGHSLGGTLAFYASSSSSDVGRCAVHLFNPGAGRKDYTELRRRSGRNLEAEVTVHKAVGDGLCLLFPIPAKGKMIKYPMEGRPIQSRHTIKNFVEEDVGAQRVRGQMDSAVRAWVLRWALRDHVLVVALLVLLELATVHTLWMLLSYAKYQVRRKYGTYPALLHKHFFPLLCVTLIFGCFGLPFYSYHFIHCNFYEASRSNAGSKVLPFPMGDFFVNVAYDVERLMKSRSRVNVLRLVDSCLVGYVAVCNLPLMLLMFALSMGLFAVRRVVGLVVNTGR